jgi:uncharacterized protein (TIGR02145 family)
MRKKINILINLILIIGTLLMFINCCEKDNNDSICSPCKTHAVFNPQKTYRTIADIDGNVYKTIVIGTQTWMAENLRATHYRNGDLIPEVTDHEIWMKLNTGAFCNYNNINNIDTIVTFGRFYNWYAVADSRNIAPTGWHVPSDSEWTILIDYLGGDSVAGGKLKETGYTHWITPNVGASNSSGFTAIPGGGQLPNGSILILANGLYWSSSEYDDGNSFDREMIYLYSNAYRMKYPKEYGLSIRCISDN